MLKTSQRSITIFGIIYHINRKQFEYFLEFLVRTKQKLKNTRVLLKWTKKRLKIALAVLYAIRSRVFFASKLAKKKKKEFR